jgi:hypothetical protein
MRSLFQIGLVSATVDLIASNLFSLAPLCQSDTSATTILGDELDVGFLEGGLYSSPDIIGAIHCSRSRT